jgi:ARP2/3 complex subunit ARPC3
MMSQMSGRSETLGSTPSKPGYAVLLPSQVFSHTTYIHPTIINHRSLISASNEQGDIIDETLDLFRANSLFRNFEIKGPGDRLLIILILFISDCLSKLGSARTPPTQIEATKTLNTLAVDNFPVPGDANFPLNAHYAPPGSRSDAGEFLEIGRDIYAS